MYSIDAKSALACLTRVEALAAKPTEPLQQVGERTKARIVNTFRTSSDPWGTAWPELKKSTLLARAKKGSPASIPLIDTSRMFQSLMTASIGDSQIVSIAGFNRFPEVHQYGYGPIPARPMFPIRNDRVELPAEWEKDIFAPVGEAFDKAIK